MSGTNWYSSLSLSLKINNIKWNVLELGNEVRKRLPLESHRPRIEPSAEPCPSARCWRSAMWGGWSLLSHPLVTDLALMQLLCPVNSLRVKLRMTMNYKLKWQLYCLREVVICKKSCPSLFRLLSQNATDWVAYKQLEFISQVWRFDVQNQGASTGRCGPSFRLLTSHVFSFGGRGKLVRWSL